MKCQKCGYEVNYNFNQCPVCGATYNPAPANYYNPNNPYYTPPRTKKLNGEGFAIVAAIILAILSPILSFIILLAMPSDDVSDTVSQMPYNDYPTFSDYESEPFYKYDMTDPAPKNSPVEFNDELFSFSNGYVQTQYEVTLEQTYRGDAALKLLGDAKIPEITTMQEIYIAKFNVKITKQNTPAYVTLISLSAFAYDSHKNVYPTLSLIDYKDNKQLLMEGESGTRWIAFVVDKDDENPYIAWSDQDKFEFFRNTEPSISDAFEVTEGEAVDSITSSDDTSSVQ